MWLGMARRAWVATGAVLMAAACGESGHHGGGPAGSGGSSGAAAGSAGSGANPSGGNGGGAGTSGASSADRGGVSGSAGDRAGGGGSSGVGGSASGGGGRSGATGGAGTSGATGNSAGEAGAAAGAGGDDTGGASSEPDREWAIWPMPNPVSSGLPRPFAYEIVGEQQVAADQVTGLMWERGIGIQAPFSGDGNGCNELSLGGFDDWRQPTLIELVSIMDWTVGFPGPTLDTSAFPELSVDIADLYWTGTPILNGAYVVDFGSGLFNARNPSTTALTRCVRGGRTTSPTTHYTIESETVHDNGTLLTWERNASTTLHLLDDAAAYCADLELGGATNWRVPSLGELTTLLDVRSTTAASVDTTAFPGDFPDVEDFAFWAQGSWLLDFEPTAPEPMHVGSLTTARVRCVR